MDDIKYIVIHYTGNNGDTAANNCRYFQGANRNASAHYFVDGGNYVYKSVPVKSVAWSVGGFYSQSGGAGSYYKKCTNANSISVEMCNCVKSVPDKVFESDGGIDSFPDGQIQCPAKPGNPPLGCQRQRVPSTLDWKEQQRLGKIQESDYRRGENESGREKRRMLCTNQVAGDL